MHARQIYASVALLAFAVAGTALGQILGGTATAPGPGDPTTIEKVDERLHELQQEAQSLSDRVGLSNAAANTAYNDLANEHDRATILLKSKKVREQAIQEKIVELTSKARQQIGSDETIKQLQRTAEVRQQETEAARARFKQQLVSQQEVDRASADAADALVRVEERKEAITANAGGGALSALNKELIAVSLDIREQEAIVSMLDERLGRWRQVINANNEFVRLQKVRNFLVQQESRQRDAANGFRGFGPGNNPQLTPPPSSAQPADTSRGNPASSAPSSPQPGR